MHAPNLDTPTLRSAWSGSNVCSIPKPRRGRIRSYTFYYVTASGHMRRLKSWSNYCLENNNILCCILTRPISSGPVTSVSLAHYSLAKRKKALTSKNIKAGWIKAGIFPFNPDRVLRNIPKPLAELTVPKASKVKVWPCPEGEVLQTPVTAEALTSLRNLIEKDTHALDEMGQQRLKKFAKADPVCFAECALRMRINSCLNRTTKPNVTNRPSQ